MPTESFWSSKDKIPISQQKVSIPAEFGLDYSAGQKIQINVPASVEFFQPKESYLKFEVDIKAPTDATFKGARRIMLDAESGGQCLIRDLRIYSGGAGRILLEEFQNYNVLTALKYDYETNDNMRKKRALTEGCGVYDATCRATHSGCPQSQANSTRNNAYCADVGTSSTTSSASFTDASRHRVKCLLPLNTGIFQSDRVFPTLLTEGLIVEIILEENTNVFRELDTTIQFKDPHSNPLFLSLDGNGSGHSGCLTTAGVNSSATSFYIRTDNQQGAGGVVGNVPFVVGQAIELVDYENNASIIGGSTAAPIIIKEIKYDAAKTAVKITVDPAIVNISALADYANHATTIGPGLDSAVVVQATSASTTPVWQPTYTIHDTELILQQVSMPTGFKARMMGMLKEGGTLNYDFLSYTNYKYSQPAGNVVDNIRLPVNESRAKAIFMIPTDASTYSTHQSMNGIGTAITGYGTDGAQQNASNVDHSVRSGLVGVWDSLSHYQILYDGKLNPSRRVNCSLTSNLVSIDQQPLIELEKALSMGGIVPLSFAKFRESACIGRALSLQDGVQDLRGKDFSLQVEYQESQVPVKNKLWMNYVAHLRRIVVKGDAISLEI
mgnify:CR=1 FL=1|tara:strand:+ start:8984 stop:10813 length:1830 start_codon:yes stop_codon:yes gene_type:complete